MKNQQVVQGASPTHLQEPSRHEDGQYDASDIGANG